jgi:threonine dehydrogenase-like Zn-dependent dehydrogenase
LRSLETIIYSLDVAAGSGHVVRSELGVKEVDARDRKLADVAAAEGAPDIVIEATGFSPLVWEAAAILDVNGVLCALSVTGGDRRTVIPSDVLNDRFVLGNRVLFGSVNAEKQDFQQGVKDLTDLSRRWPGALERIITRVPLEQVRTALDDQPAGTLKTVLEL